MADEKNRRARPWPIEPATVIGKRACPECGGTVQVKINKAQKAYANCYHADSDGNACGYQQRWGAVPSERMRKAWHDRQAKGGTGSPQKPAPAPAQKPNVSKPAPAPVPETANKDNGGEYSEYGF